MAISITDASFENEVLKNKNIVLVDFWAPWCGPCKMLTPIIDELSKELEGQVAVTKMNIDDNPEFPSKYGVRSIPTLMLFKDGAVVDTKIGALNKAKLLEWINGLV